MNKLVYIYISFMLHPNVKNKSTGNLTLTKECCYFLSSQLIQCFSVFSYRPCHHHLDLMDNLFWKLRFSTFNLKWSDCSYILGQFMTQNWNCSVKSGSGVLYFTHKHLNISTFPLFIFYVFSFSSNLFSIFTSRLNSNFAGVIVVYFCSYTKVKGPLALLLTTNPYQV